MQLLSLNCFILDDHQKKVFTVEIVKDKNISFLKDQIKKKNAHLLNHVNAKDLELSQISLPVNDKVEDAVNNVCLEPLHPLEQLLNLFHSTKDNHLQIIVQAPSNGEPILSLLACQMISLIPSRGHSLQEHKRRGKQG